MCMRELCKSGVRQAWMGTASAAVLAPTVTRSAASPRSFPSSQGKAFVKDTLRCMALGLRQRFSCLHRRCSAVSEMVHALQRECYSKHQLCLALQDHMDTVDSLVQFHLMFPPGWGRLINRTARFLLSARDANCCTVKSHDPVVHVCPLQTLRGTGEIPVTVSGGREAVGDLAAAWAMWAALGDAVQHRRWRLPPRPVRNAADYHRGTIIGSLAPERSRAPAAADGWEEPHAQRWGRDGTWSSSVWEGDCFHVINEKHAKVQTGYTEWAHVGIVTGCELKGCSSDQLI